MKMYSRTRLSFLLKLLCIIKRDEQSICITLSVSGRVFANDCLFTATNGFYDTLDRES